MLDEGVTSHLFVREVEADKISFLGFSDRDNDVTQLLHQGVAGQQDREVCNDSEATWIDPDNDVKGFKVNL